MPISTRGILWSDMGGQNFRTVDFGWSACADEVVLVQTRSSVLSSRVGKSKICSSPVSLMKLPNFSW